jgi:hypothetical protein
MPTIITMHLSLSKGMGRMGEAGGSAPHEYPCTPVGDPRETPHSQSSEPVDLQERRAG